MLKPDDNKRDVAALTEEEDEGIGNTCTDEEQRAEASKES
jgi:hypothetical protein